MIIVSDASPLSGLIQIGKLYLLNQLYENIIIPTAVNRELSALKKINVDLSSFENANWIEVKKVRDTHTLEQLLRRLDAGESEAIALAIEMKIDNILIDERRGRSIARKYGLQPIGLLGIFKEAKHQKLLDAVKPLIDDLISKANFRLAPELIKQVLTDVGEIS